METCCISSCAGTNGWIVRIEVFPERDGNLGVNGCGLYVCVCCPNRGLPWKGWKPSRRNFWSVAPSLEVRIEVFPERDGNITIFRWSYRRTFSCPNRGLPWKGWKRWWKWMLFQILCFVRIEVFPERDGNLARKSLLLKFSITCPNRGLPWKGWKLYTAGKSSPPKNYWVRIEVFPERDGNPSSTMLTIFPIKYCPNRGLPWKGWKPRRLWWKL